MEGLGAPNEHIRRLGGRGGLGGGRRSLLGLRLMASDLLIEVENQPGALAKVTAAISDAGVNISAVTCTRPSESAALHILVKYPEAAKHALATAGMTITSEREVVVVDADDRPGVLADLARKVAEAGINLDLLYLATKTRIVFGSQDLDGLRAALGPAAT